MSLDETAILEATDVLYWSPHDEAAFFERLDKLSAVQSYGGRGRTLDISVSTKSVDESALDEFVALYRRYLLDPTELQVFSSGDLGGWFSAPERWWHTEVFGAGPKVPLDQRPNVRIGDAPIYRWNVTGDIGSHTNIWPPAVDVNLIGDHAILAATGVRYYSEFDETAFFEWLDKNPQVESSVGRGDTLYISVNVNTGDEAELSELAALYSRYNIDMKELRALSAGNFGPWFSDPKWWWHTPVFG